MTTVQGEIQEVKNLTTKANKPFNIVKVNNTEYSYFPNEGETFGFKTGDTIEFNHVAKGKYNNMYDPKACAIPAGDLASYDKTPKPEAGIDYEGLYQECIQTASKAIEKSDVEQKFKDMLIGDFAACVNTHFIEQNKQRRVSAKFV